MFSKEKEKFTKITKCYEDILKQVRFFIIIIKNYGIMKTIRLKKNNKNIIMKGNIPISSNGNLIMVLIIYTYHS